MKICILIPIFKTFFFNEISIASAPLNPELDGRFNGCTIPFQYVNPYYHELTARTCINILGYNVNRVPNAPIEYQIGCDCVFPFAMNYQGHCIQEDECNEREAFGENFKPIEKNKSTETNTKPLITDQRSQQQQQEQSQPQQQQRKQQNDSNHQRILANSVRSKY